ncbi:ExeA family protein [Planctomicrobium sp. SH668]|uniref:ExeA family protein n=1 Tax=Planctomicrobium sp. SH668 TaxID=3448126 RepID=UPI003F5C8531
MYENFFGLHERPFSTAPKVDEFVGIASFQDALDSLVHCITQSRGIAILTSAPGMGKTMLCKRLGRLLSQNHQTVILNSSSIENRLGLLQGILFEFNMGYVGLTEQEARLKLLQVARDIHAEQKRILLILDDADHLPLRVFEEIRTLTEYAPDGEHLIQAVLSGTFSLEEQLADPALTSFNQRVGAQICLQLLPLTDAIRFLGERFRACGQPDLLSVFTEEALDLMCRASDGNLRCLTQLVDHVLLLAFADEQRPADQGTVRKALLSLRELPLNWNEVPGEAAAIEEAPTQWNSSPLDDSLEHEGIELHFEHPGPISPTELETDEFPIPEFLRLDDGSMTSVSDHLVDVDSSSGEKSSHAHDRACTLQEAPSSPFSSEQDSMEFAVFEVGAGIDVVQPELTPEEAVEHSSEWRATEQILSFPIPTYELAEEHESDLSEVVVIDRYTMLDRISELPEERRSSVDMSLLDQVEADQNFETTTRIEQPPKFQIPEEDMLELVNTIRTEIQEYVEPPFGSEIREYSEQRVTRRIDSPEPLVVPTVEQKPEAKTPSTIERRFEQLFTRLRLRRQKVRSELEGEAPR